MTEVKMPDFYDVLREGYLLNDGKWFVCLTKVDAANLVEKLEPFVKQYGDDRAREALEMAALKFETQHAWLTNALRDSAANFIRALAKETK